MLGTVHIPHQLTAVVLYLLVWVSACLWQLFSYVLTVTIYRKLQELEVKEMHILAASNFHCKQHLLGSIWHKAFCISPVQWPLPCGVPQSHRDGLLTWEGNAHSGRSRETYSQDMTFKQRILLDLVASSVTSLFSLLFDDIVSTISMVPVINSHAHA